MSDDEITPEEARRYRAALRAIHGQTDRYFSPDAARRVAANDYRRSLRTIRDSAAAALALHR